MKRTLIAIAATTALLSGTAMAKQPTTYQPFADQNWEVSLGAGQVKSELQGQSLENNLVLVGFAYGIRNDSGKFSFTPEFYYGKDVSPAELDDTLAFNDVVYGGPGAEYELENTLSFSARLALHPTEDFYVYVRPSYTRTSFEITSPSGDNYSNDAEWEAGLGVGAGMNIDAHFSLDASFTRLSGDADLAGVTLRYRF